MPAVMMVLFALSRWPGLMPENFSAVYGLVFCAAVYFPGKLAWFLPLVTLLVTDVIMNLFYYHADLVSGYMLVNYLAYGGILWLGRQFSARSSWLSLLSGGLLGAILFYLVTNTAAWMQNPEYAKTLAGWIQALTIGTPGWPHTWEFFRNTLLSGGLFTGLFAGAMKLSEAAEEAEQAEEEGETAAEPKEPKTEEAEA
ncbi:MAG: hypothetical protein HY674_03095 [Chloroflexi bacterium]|nr:hypothetical protein [Chloroflexota bacterium]